MNKLLKFILTEDLYRGSESGVQNGTIYHESSDGTFTCLNEGEFYVGIGSQFGKLKIYGSDIELVSGSGNLVDLIESTDVPMSFKSIDLYIRYLGFGGDKFIVGDYVLRTRGGDLILDIPNASSIAADFNFTRGDLEQLDDDEIDTMISELESELSYYENLSTGESIELIQYGDITDYLSTKTLVNVHQSEPIIQTSENKNFKLDSRILENSSPITVDPRYYDPDNYLDYTDRNIYYLTPRRFEFIERIVNFGDLLELNINYKYFMRDKSPIIHGNESILASNTSDPDPVDNTAYYLNEEDTITKIDIMDPDGEFRNITWDGYHITYGNLTECTKTCRLEYIPGFIEYDDLIINITEDSIVLYSKNEEVVEYYISTCKLINKAVNQ